MDHKVVIHTSKQGWLARLTEAYRKRLPILIIDDANVGINPSEHSLFEMGIKAELSSREIAAGGVSAGMGVVGVGVVIMACLDPEPTTKLSLLIGSGVVLTLCGGLGAIKVLTKERPPNIKFGKSGFEMSWS